jgi:hypothetical protein
MAKSLEQRLHHNSHGVCTLVSNATDRSVSVHHVGCGLERGTFIDLLDPDVHAWPMKEVHCLAEVSIHCCELLGIHEWWMVVVIPFLYISSSPRARRCYA